jgi:hypothetical protein
VVVTIWALLALSPRFVSTPPSSWPWNKGTSFPGDRHPG